jgi:hypothetical protein
VGLYSEGVGIMTALTQGLENKFRSRVETAIKIDRDYLKGGPLMVYGRYFYKLPWPKRDIDESARILGKGHDAHPDNWLMSLYLADSLWEVDRQQDARNLANSVLEGPLGDDPADARRNKERAKRWLEAHK